MKTTQETGKRFGRLVVLSQATSGNDGGARWACKCDCGIELIVRGTNLRNGNTQSCGCLQKEKTKLASLTHGCSNASITPEYRSWASMIARCENEKYHHYHRYGGRGIKICASWRNSFENFLAGMGLRPKGTSLDRIDNDGNYEPGNCRWATSLEQRHNRSDTKAFKRVQP